MVYRNINLTDEKLWNYLRGKTVKSVTGDYRIHTICIVGDIAEAFISNIINEGTAWFPLSYVVDDILDKRNGNELDLSELYTKEPVVKTDPIVGAVMKQYRDRSAIGIGKYNTTLDENTDGVLRFLQHLQEELMDATLYIEKLKKQIGG